MTFTWTSFFFNVLCSIVASFIFLFAVLFLFRPWVKISHFVCKNKSEFQGENTMYFIKVVNFSIFTAFEVRAELSILERYPTPPKGMMNKRIKPLNLVFDTYSSLEGYRPRWWRENASHCIRFRTQVDLETIVSNEFKSVQVQIMLRHGLTGLVKVFTQEYADPNQIIEGRFAYGTKFAVI